jgi:Helix-turn-helix domain
LLNAISENAVSSVARHLFMILKDFARGKNWPECWPGKWRLAEETGRSVRSVQRYLRELEKCGAIEVVRADGKRNSYRILLGVSVKISSMCTDAPMTPMSGVGLTPMSGVGLTPMSGVELCTINKEATKQQAAQITEVTAAAAELKISEEDIKSSIKNVFDDLVKFGLAPTEHMATIIDANQELAQAVLVHCQKRFRNKKKPVENPAGYLTACFRDPAKFGFVKRDGLWLCPEMDAHDAAERDAERSAFIISQNLKDRAKRQAEAEKSYADMKASWEHLPESARQEVREFVAKSSPLFHLSGLDTTEFALACMNEASSLGRTNWLRTYQGLPPLKGAIYSRRL